MARKGKQAGGHMPLTHYERTKKFASSNYGTTTTRLSGDTQVAFGHCSLSLAPIVKGDDHEHNNDNNNDDDQTSTTIAMVTPSGHLYAKEAIVEYLLTKTQDYQERRQAYEQQEQTAAEKADTTQAQKRQRQDAFDESHQVPRGGGGAGGGSLAQKKKARTTISTSEASSGGNNAKEEDDDDPRILKRTSYWLPDMQPSKIDVVLKEPDRPSSPYSGEPLRRKDLREVALLRRRRPKSSNNNNNNDNDVLCAISGKPVRMQPAVAYWTKDKSQPGVVVSKDVYDMTILADEDNKNKTKKKATGGGICPLTNVKIKHTIELRTGGSGFASHNAVQVKTYKPTIT